MEYVRVADRLTWHAQTEEEIYYPAAIVIGEYLKLKLASANAKMSSKSLSTKKTGVFKERNEAVKTCVLSFRTSTRTT